MRAILVCDGRCHAIAAVVENFFGKRECIICFEAPAGSELFRTAQCLLNVIESGPVKDSLVFAGEVIRLVDDLADVGAVAEKMSKRPLAKPNPATD